MAKRCPKGICDGSGWLLDEAGDAIACQCRKEELLRPRPSISTIVPQRYRGASFERPPVPSIERTTPYVVEAVREYAKDISQRIDRGQGLWLYGRPGTGKTTLAMIVSNEAIKRGHSVAIYSLPNLLSKIRRTYDSDSRHTDFELINQLVSVDLLHLDDVGVERSTDWVLEQLYSIVNGRYEQCRSGVMTTNYDEEKLAEQIGGQTVSRLLEICENPYSLHGDDMRQVLQPSGDPVGD